MAWMRVNLLFIGFSNNVDRLSLPSAPGCIYSKAKKEFGQQKNHRWIKGGY
jgi:hypothetical protein